MYNEDLADPEWPNQVILIAFYLPESKVFNLNLMGNRIIRRFV